MLNEFYEMVTDAILSHRGTVLKFVGDEVFAVFGAPLPVDDHPQVALESAMEIQRRAPELDAELSHLGIPPMMFGIGMNSGQVVAAHIGGGKRRQYDIVGDTVNLASRLCGQAGKGEIVIPETMRDRLSSPPEMSSMGRGRAQGPRRARPALQDRRRPGPRRGPLTLGCVPHLEIRGRETPHAGLASSMSPKRRRT